MRAKEFAAFINKREGYRLADIGKPDPIIAKYRFCNVVRADDRVTKFIHQWAQPWSTHEDLWFAIVVARLFNLPETLMLAKPSVLPFNPGRLQRVLQARKDMGYNIFNAAYIVSTNGIAMDKIDYVIDRVLTPLWEHRKRYRPKGQTLNDYHKKLCEAQGLGSFMAGQVIADLKYFPALADAEDWQTFAASGPGSKRGLNRVMERPLKTTWPEGLWRATLGLLIAKTRPMLSPTLYKRMSAQDYQNCLCEFDKYERARLHEGEPKQIYKPYEEKN